MTRNRSWVKKPYSYYRSDLQQWAALFAGLCLVVQLAACTDATPVPNNKLTLSFPDVTGVKEIAIDQELKAALVKAYGVADVNYQLYVSDDNNDTFAKGLDSFLIGQGYKFSLGQETQPKHSGSMVISFYSKPNAPDVSASFSTISSNPDQDYASLNLSQVSMQKFMEQVKGRKSIASIITGPELAKSLGANAPTIAPVYSGTIKGGLGSTPVSPTPLR